MYYDYKGCIAYCEDNSKQKPLIQCEYAHAMGNSEGGFKEYWDLVRKYPKYQGGFIWDYVDQAILTKDENGTSYLGYGGDFNEGYHDGNFSGNGLMFADRTETPKMKEVRICYQNVGFEHVDWETGEVTLKNRSCLRRFLNTGSCGNFLWTNASVHQEALRQIVRLEIR